MWRSRPQTRPDAARAPRRGQPGAGPGAGGLSPCRRLRKGAALALGAVFLLAAGLGPAGCGLVDDGPDRIVLVTIDTLRADRVGAYGDLAARTPTLDRLAREGARFEHAVAPTPLTLPSHASLLSGLDPDAHGVRHNSVFAVLPDVPLLAERMRETGRATAAFVAAFVLHERFGLGRGFDVYDDDVGGRFAAQGPFAMSERRGDRVVDAAVEWLAGAPERFFLWVHLYDPHADYTPPEEYLEARPGDPYSGEIAFADAQVGRLLAEVRRRFGGEDLLVAVTSDHGESLGEHGEVTHSYTIYDATQLVPLVFAGMGVPAGRVVEPQVRLVDVAPTLLEMAGAEPLAEVDGRSLVPLLEGEAEAEPRVAYVETLATQLEMGWSPLLGLRTDSTKYIRAPQPELYDLEEDPDERRNLALRRPEEVERLDAVLDSLLANARPAEPVLELRSEDRARLESLGYVMPSRASLASGTLGVVGGPNPRDHMQDAAALQEASDMLSQGWPERALERLEAVQAEGPLVARSRAMAALGANRAQEAAEVLEALRAAGEAGPPDLVLLGTAHTALGRLDAAREAFQAARALDDAAHGPLLGMAILAEREGRPEEAAEWIRRAEEVAPRPAMVRVERAILHLRQGEPEAADAILERLGPETLTTPNAAMKLASAERDAGRVDRAASVLERALEERPAHRQLLGEYAIVLHAAGRTEAALEAWQRIHGLDPRDPGAKNDLAWGLALAERDLDRALALVGESLEALGETPALLDTLATVHLARREPAKALEAAGRGLAEAPPGLRAHLLYVRAASLATLGREAEAREALRALDGEPVPLESPWRERAEALGHRLDSEPDEATPTS